MLTSIDQRPARRMDLPLRRKRALSYDQEEAFGAIPLVGNDSASAKGLERSQRRRMRNILVAGVCVVVGLVLLGMRRRRPVPMKFVSWSEHSFMAKGLRDEIAAVTRQKQEVTRRRRDGQPKQKIDPRPWPPLSPLRLVEDGLDLAVSDQAKEILVSRLATAHRELARQQRITENSGAEYLTHISNRMCSEEQDEERKLRIASVNLWQPALDTWDIRRPVLAEFLKDVDIIAAQEVRGVEQWAVQLAKELEFPYSMYVPGFGANGVDGGSRPNGGWTEEGVAVISKFPLRDLQIVGMPPSQKSSDRNPRATIGVLVATTFGDVRVIASHLSYDRQQQCDSVSGKLLPWLNDLWTKDEMATMGQILLGDLNTYPDFEWPIDLLTMASDLRQAIGGPCATSSTTTPLFVDAWVDHGDDDNPDGWTFPNPETMNLDPARPDRVLIRSHRLHPIRSFIRGCDSIKGKPTRPSDHRILIVDLDLR